MMVTSGDMWGKKQTNSLNTDDEKYGLLSYTSLSGILSFDKIELIDCMVPCPLIFFMFRN